MPLLDIENVIKSPELKSRFRLVYVAGLRARELNSPKDDTLPPQTSEHHKVTTTALSEIIQGKIVFTRTDEPVDAETAETDE